MGLRDTRVKAEVHLKTVVFPPLNLDNLGLIRISRLRFKQSKNSINAHFTNLYMFLGVLNFWEIFGDVKELVKFGEKRNIKD